MDGNFNLKSTELLCACFEGNTQVVKTLLAEGVDPNATGDIYAEEIKDAEKITFASHISTRDMLGDLLVISDILEQENFNLENAYEVPKGEVIINKIKEIKQQFTPLHAAACAGHLGIFKLLEERGADLRHEIRTGSVLHTAAF